jgi:hypothetical protein
MADRKIRIPFPTPNSPLVEGTEIAVKESVERWTEITLEDGSVLRIKPAVLSAVRIDGQYDPEGNPMYALRAGQVLTVFSTPDMLRKPEPARKAN